MSDSINEKLWVQIILIIALLPLFLVVLFLGFPGFIFIWIMAKHVEEPTYLIIATLSIDFVWWFVLTLMMT